MSHETTSVDHTVSPQLLLDRGRDFLEHGDFAAARRDLAGVLRSNAPLAMKSEAGDLIRRTQIDPWEIAAGVIVLLITITLFLFFGLGH